MLRRHGFTLIELLVVIAIIAILAAILFPVFMQARDKGRQAACSTNAKQIGTAFMQYTQDWTGKYPQIPPWSSGTGGSWTTRIMPYVKNVAVFKCKSDMRSWNNAIDAQDVQGAWGLDIRTFPYSKDLLSFAYNGLVAGYDSNTPLSPTPLSEAKIRRSSRVVMLAETPMYKCVTVAYPCYINYFCDVPSGDSYTHSRRHSGGDNMIFADGHAKWFILRKNLRYLYTDPVNKISFDPEYNP